MFDIKHITVHYYNNRPQLDIKGQIMVVCTIAILWNGRGAILWAILLYYAILESTVYCILQCTAAIDPTLHFCSPAAPSAPFPFSFILQGALHFILKLWRF